MPKVVDSRRQEVGHFTNPGPDTVFLTFYADPDPGGSCRENPDLLHLLVLELKQDYFSLFLSTILIFNLNLKQCNKSGSGLILTFQQVQIRIRS